MNNLIGKKFGKLVVKKFSHKNKNRYYWICVCDCGVKKPISSDSLENGDTISCGCVRTHFKDLTNKKFGELLVLSKSVINNPRHMRWKCKCSCGRILDIFASNLKRGNSTSCGHLRLSGISRSETMFLDNETLERDYNTFLACKKLKEFDNLTGFWASKK